MTYLETDARNECVRAFEMTLEQLGRVGEDEYAWKWALVALHNATQNILVLAVSGPAKIGALRADIAEKWLTTYYAGEADFPPERLDSFLNLCDRASEQTAFHDADVREDLRRLNTIRNSFIHFLDQTWSLELEGLPRIALSALRLAAHVRHSDGFEAEWLMPPAQQLDTLDALINELRVRLTVLSSQYEGAT